MKLAVSSIVVAQLLLLKKFAHLLSMTWTPEDTNTTTHVCVTDTDALTIDVYFNSFT